MEKKDTAIHLPKTDFPMKGNLNQREPEFFKKWEDSKLYETLLEKRKNSPKYILHDGPPYANGNIHMGHVLNKVLKDIVVRYKAFKGYAAPYIPGWDCHGMPIEHKVSEELGGKRNTMSKLEIRKLCNDYAMKYVRLQRNQFKRLGIMGDWEKPYLTLNKEYEDKMVDIFWEMYKKGLVYKGLKPVYWCSKCETALAEAEVEYQDASAPTVFVRFKVSDSTKAKKKIPADAYVVIWTTTPWTLPANVAIAVNPEIDYVLAEINGTKYVLAKELLAAFIEKVGGSATVLEEFKGVQLEHLKTQHPFIAERVSPVILADYVTLEAGTGCVHIAPGHGYEDYIYGLKYNLPILNPVDSKGRFTEEFAPLKGKYVLEANKDIVEMMRANESLLYTETISHSYPHCWRCKSPIIFRATSQWFISMEKDNFRGQALEAIKKVKWLNEWGENRITKMVESRPDWCISRQRVWGVPIFVFNCTACEKNIVTEDTIAKVHEIIRRDGSDGWYKYSEKEILGEDFKCPHCKAGIENIKKENDIFDVWFDSGSSSFSVLENNETVAWPADLYLEGSDQYRGWFQSSLLTAIGFKGKSPYKAVISTGWVVDGQGRAMHKSLGNIIDPLDLIKQSGADVLRLWVASEDFTADQPISNEIMARVTDSYRRIRNTFRFMLGCMEDFSKEDAVPYEKLNKLDKYAIDRLETLAGNIDKYYESFEFFKVYKDYMQFCSTFLSSFYFDIIKDRIYTYKNDSLGRRGAQTVVYKMLMKMVKLIAPVLVFTADEAWQFIPAKLRDEEFVQWTLWNEASEKRLGENELKEWDMINEIREIVMKKAEEKRAEKIIKHPYECDVTVKYSSKTLAGVLEKFKEDLAEIFIVSHVILVPKDIKEADWTADLEISVDKASGEKCGRCWRYETSVGKNVDYVELCERCIENL